MDLNQFFDDLASQKPVPGGGSASCVAATMAVALLEMVIQLSIGRGNEETIDEQFKNILQELGKIKTRLFELAEEDAKGYQEVMDTFKLPKGTKQEIEYRKDAIRKAFEGAISSPLTLMETAVDLLEWNAFILEHGNKNAFSDAGVAFYLIQVAYEGGKMNVLINLDSIHDPSLKNSYLKRVMKIENSFNTNKQKVENQVQPWMAAIIG